MSRKRAGPVPARDRAARRPAGGARGAGLRHGTRRLGRSRLGGEHGGFAVRLRRSEPRPQAGRLGRDHLAQPAAAARAFHPGDDSGVAREGRLARGERRPRERQGLAEGREQTRRGGDREPLRQLDGGLPGLVAEAQEDADVPRRQGRDLEADPAQVLIQMRRDPYRIGRAAVEAEERLPLLDLPELGEALARRPLQLGRRAGRERRAGPRRQQMDGRICLPARSRRRRTRGGPRRSRRG